jgi:Peptidase family M1 domain
MKGARTSLLAALALAVPLVAGPQEPTPTPSPGAAERRALADRLQRAWQTKDAAAYVGLWDFASDAERAEETAFAAERFRAEESTLAVFTAPGETPDTAQLNARAFTVVEPRGRLEQWQYQAERRKGALRLVGREPLPGIEGLLHLSLDPAPYRAEGLTVRFEDFELRLLKGSLFTSPPAIGPTALVFVGEAEVVMRPAPAAEQQQLVQFCGAPELRDRVKAAFIRIHPGDLHRVLTPARFTPNPEGASDLAAARAFYDEQVSRAFVLDTSLPRSPWWIFPGLGDAAASFRTAHHGTLTYALSTDEPEGISLFDRDRRRQVCLYPRAGREAHYDEDEGRPVDVLEHDLQVRFDPQRSRLEGQDTLRLRLNAASSTLRLRLDDSLAVTSIVSEAAGDHAFFRVRGQDSLMVSLGALSGRIGEIALTVRYQGVHWPTAVEQELQGASPGADLNGIDREIIVDPVLTYSNRTAWYPQAGADDYARARLRFDLPEGWTALTGGARVVSRREAGRNRFEYKQDQPGKYITVVVGRFQEAGKLTADGRQLEAFGLARTKNDAERTLAQAAEILRFFEAEFGPYPYASLRIAVVEGATPGGHSPPGMVILSRRPPLARGDLRDDPASFWDLPGFFVAHELAHQWWGHGVAGQNYRERWLAEGFAQYAAALWTRHDRGEEAFQTVLKRLSRWALRQNDEGPIHLGHRLGHVVGNAQIYRSIVYDKGAYVLHMLRGIVGEEAFRKGVRALQAEHRFGKVGTADLQAALQQASGKDLHAYFDAWVYGTTLPAIEYSSHAKGKGAGHGTLVTVRARDLPGPVPLLLSAYRGGQRETQQVTLDPAGGSFSFDRPGVGRIEINEDRGLLAVVSKR